MHSDRSVLGEHWALGAEMDGLISQEFLCILQCNNFPTIVGFLQLDHHIYFLG